MLKAVIFDMDGVIIDSEPMHLKAAILALKEYNIDITAEYLAQFTGSTTYYMCQKMIEDFKIDATPDEIFCMNEKMRISILEAQGHIVIPYIIDLMKDLHHHGVKLIIASSSHVSAIEEVMSSLQISEYFEGYVSGVNVANPKPAPDIFLEAVKRLQVNPDECIVIEDSMHGVNAAAAAGISCIGFINPNSGDQDLSNASYLVEGFDEVDFNFVKYVYEYAHCEAKIITTTERLIIKEMTEEDVNILYPFAQEEDIQQYIDDMKESLSIEKDKMKAYIHNVYHFYGYGLWGVFLKDSGTLIGRCGIELKNIDGSMEHEIGYFIAKDYQGNGYAKECINAVINYSFTNLHIPRIVAVIDKNNIKSIQLAEKLGMVFFGECIRNHRKYNKYYITS